MNRFRLSRPIAVESPASLDSAGAAKSLQQLDFLVEEEEFRDSVQKYCSHAKSPSADEDRDIDPQPNVEAITKAEQIFQPEISVSERVDGTEHGSEDVHVSTRESPTVERPALTSETPDTESKGQPKHKATSFGESLMEPRCANVQDLDDSDEQRSAIAVTRLLECLGDIVSATTAEQAQPDGSKRWIVTKPERLAGIIGG